MSINSRTKGKQGELELASTIYEQTGIRLHRNLIQTRSGGYDLLVGDDQVGPVADHLRQYAIECKRAKAATPAYINKWWEQATRQANDAGKIPCLAYRADRHEWRVIIPMSVLNFSLPSITDNLDYTVNLSVNGYSSVLRECL